MKTTAYRNFTQPVLSKGQQLGADIKAARTLYAKFYEVDVDKEPVDVNKWLREANEIRKFLRVDTIQEALKEINTITQ